MTLPDWVWMILSPEEWDDDGGNAVRAALLYGEPEYPGIGHKRPYDSLEDTQRREPRR